MGKLIMGDTERVLNLVNDVLHEKIKTINKLTEDITKWAAFHEGDVPDNVKNSLNVLVKYLKQ